RVKINSYPFVRELIDVKTWASNFRKFYANREFKILNKNQEELVNASSIWIFLDMVRKRPLRVTKDIADLYGLDGNILFHEFYDFNRPFESKNGLVFRVRKSDIDYNNHVNNVKYFQWMLETVPKYFDDQYILREFEIQYKKEVGLGSLINSSYFEEKNEDEIILLHKIEEQGDIRAFGKTIWKKRP